MNFISKPTWPFAPVIKPFQSQSAARLFAALQIIVTLCSLIFLLFGCGFAGTPPGDRTVVVTIDPTAVTLAVGQTQQFQATVKHSANSAVSWTVNNISGGNASIGTISSAGLYKAPSSLPNPASVTVTATSQAAPQSSASATVAITDSIQVNVSPKTASVLTGGSQVFTAAVSGAGNLPASVIWSVNGINGGNSTVGSIISSAGDTGVYTAPAAVPSPATVTITATSTADATRSGMAIVTVTCATGNSISPATANVSLGQTQLFTASLCVAPTAQISWDVNGIAGGNATFGTIVVTGTVTAQFTAPQNLPNPNSVQIHATSGAATASAIATIVSNVSVNISPVSVTLNLNQRQTFTPTVTNTTDTALRWTINGIANGTAALGQVCEQDTNPCQPPPSPFSGNIDYVAPSAVPVPNPVTLAATSAADPSRSASSIITIAGSPASVSVTVSPQYAFLEPSICTPSTEQFFANVAGSPNTAITWSVQSAVPAQSCSGAACGSVNSEGLYTAPAEAPSPNAISVIATSVANPAKSATATIAITSGPVIEVLLPSSVFSGAIESFPLAVQGENFVPGTGPSASTILINGVARGTTCATSTGCATALNLSDVQTASTLTIEIQNPAPAAALSNPVPFVIAPLDTSVGVISLTAANPSVAQIVLVVPEPTTAAASAPLNVDSIGLLTGGNCEIQGSPVTVLRPVSGTATASLCVHGDGLDPTFRYSFTGAGGAPNGSDMPVTASAITGLFSNLIELDLQISSATLPGVRTLFITTLNNDRAVTTGVLEVK